MSVSTTQSKAADGPPRGMRGNHSRLGLPPRGLSSCSALRATGHGTELLKLLTPKLGITQKDCLPQLCTSFLYKASGAKEYRDLVRSLTEGETKGRSRELHKGTFLHPSPLLYFPLPKGLQALFFFFFRKAPRSHLFL